MKNLTHSTFFSLLVVFVLVCTYTVQLSAQTPKISIQGTLKTATGASVPDGPQAVTFRLYQQELGGTHVWEEAATVDVNGGIYSHYLGSVTALNASNFATTLYLGVRIGSYELTPRSELSYSPYAFSVYTVVCSGALGDVKYSILNPTQFAAVNGACWVPMDGRTLAPTDQLRITTGLTALPDASGVFFRSQEFSGGADRDPSRTSGSAIAQVQTQAVQAHGHNVTDPGHTHSYLDRRQNGGAGDKCGCAGQSNPASQNTADDGRTTGSSTTGISIPATGNGPETRPVNMNLWTYIRIN